MVQSVSRRPVRPATVADVHRLADLAEARGLDVVVDAHGRHFVTSHGNPFALHVVTGFSCDCRGFVAVGRCTHHSLLLRSLGWLPEPEHDMPFVAQTPADCASCSGCGVVHYRSGNQERCLDCGGSGRVPVPPAVVPAVQPERLAA